MKKLIAFVLVAAFLITASVGCSGTPSTKGGSTPSTGGTSK